MRALVLAALALVPLAATAGCLEPGDLLDLPHLDDEAPPTPATPNATDVDPSRDGGLPPDVQLQTVVEGLENLTHVAEAPDDTGRLFLLEQPGRVRVVDDGQLVDEPYLDRTNRTTTQGWEQGLLGLAFDPAFERNGRLYLSYTGDHGASILEAVTVEDPTGWPNAPNTSTMLAIDQPYKRHNGGHLAFGPDGYLHWAIGDGGRYLDPDGFAQNRSHPLGSLLRIDVSEGQAAAPPDNPFVGDGDGHDLVWAYGLRNPWRFSFDRQTGDLFIADVGQEHREEIDHEPAASDGGVNYGWNVWEGDRYLKEADHGFDDAPRQPYTFPEISYPHEYGRCAVVGGPVYRGPAIPALDGYYLFADLCSGEVRAASNTTEGWASWSLVSTELEITAIGTDADGDAYVVARGGSLHRIVSG